MKLMYNQNDVKIYHGDARALDAIPDESVEMVITSPPYLNAREYSQWATLADYLADMQKAWSECYRVMKDGARIAINVVHGYGRPGDGKDGYIPLGNYIVDQIDAWFTLRGVVVWDKGTGVMETAWGSWLSASNPSLRDQHEVIVIAHKGSAKREGGESTIDADTFVKATSSIWFIPPAHSSWHPAPFPDEIPRRLIQLYTFKGDTILDPFMGSGTTPFTAAREGRKGIGVELNKDYIVQAVGPMFIKEE